MVTGPAGAAEFGPPSAVRRDDPVVDRVVCLVRGGTFLLGAVTILVVRQPSWWFVGLDGAC
jgi:hypothetical protein